MYFCRFQNTFSLIRARGGHNPHPNVEQARAAVRAVSSNQIMTSIRPNESNCEEDMEENVAVRINNISNRAEQSLQAPMSLSSEDAASPEFLSPILEIPVEFEAGSLLKMKDCVEQEVMNYIYGNIIFRFVDCAECREHMSDEESKSRLIVNKTLPHCHLVCPKLLPIINQIRNFVLTFLPQIGHLPNISSILSQEFENLFFPTCNFHFLHEQCRDRLHKVVLREVVKCFIRVFCKRKNEALKMKLYKTSDKLS